MPEAADEDALRSAAAGFTPLASRLQVIGTVGGVTFVDDSLSTNVLPTLAAVDAFPGRRVALIAGGHDRGIDYAPLAAGLHGRGRAAAGAGPARQRPADPGRDRGGAARQGRGDRVPGPGRGGPAGLGLGPAGRRGAALARRASFGPFRDYRDRAAAFARAMRACTGEPGSAG